MRKSYAKGGAIKSLARTRWMCHQMYGAQQAITQGKNPTSYLDQLNALVCGQGTWFYLSPDGRHVCMNTVERTSLAVGQRVFVNCPISLRHGISKITVYHPGGTAEIIKDVTVTYIHVATPTLNK